MLGCCVLMFYGTWRQHDINATTMSAVTGIPMIWVYGVGYLASVAMGALIAGNLIKLARGRIADERPDPGPRVGRGRAGPCAAAADGGHEMTILVFVVSLLGAMALGMPIAFALLVCGVALMLHLDQFDTQILAQNLISGADNFPLMAVPFFMLAGELMNAGGMSRRIVNSAMAWVGHFRGGLGYVAVFAALIMASLSGSAVADTAALAAAADADDAQGRLPHGPLGRPDRRRRHHRAGDPAVDRLHRLRRHRRRLDHQAVPGRHRARPADGRRR